MNVSRSIGTLLILLALSVLTAAAEHVVDQKTFVPGYGCRVLGHGLSTGMAQTETTHSLTPGSCESGDSHLLSVTLSAISP